MHLTLSKLPACLLLALAACSGGGGSSNDLTIGPGPVPEFSCLPNSGPVPLTVQFTDESELVPTAWEWDFDNDGVIDSTEKNPTHTYTTAGSFAVRLVVRNADGSNTTLRQQAITAEAGVALGDPLPGLTAAERASFDRGRELFKKRFTPSQGLGPLYNATSCESCHSEPVLGGGADLYRNFYMSAFFGTTPLTNLPSVVVPAFGGTSTEQAHSLTRGRYTIPNFPGMVTTAQRNSIPLFGVGLFEFVSNETLLANTDPEDANADGVSGRVNNDGAGMGRFGLKSQSNNIELFTRAPLMNQMGITSNPLRGSAGTVSLEVGMAPQASSSPNSPTIDNDGVADPEIAPQELADLIAFTRFLAPPQARAFGAAEQRGRAQFTSIGCAVCHIPELPSSRGPVRAYTDLLIHDMGDDLADGMALGRPQVTLSGPDHTGREFRTQPLWGVSQSHPYLHDGRAETIDEAIRMHGGEGLGARQRYEALDAQQRADLLTFLEAL